jgi:hypothetical protein
VEDDSIQYESRYVQYYGSNTTRADRPARESNGYVEEQRMNTAIYLELMIQWHRDILETCCNDFDRRWKKGQIDMLQNMVDEIDAI